MNGDELQVLIGQMWYPIDPYMTGEIQNIIDSNPLPETDSSSSGYASSCSGKYTGYSSWTSGKVASAFRAWIIIGK